MFRHIIKGLIIFICVILCQTIKADAEKLPPLRVSVSFFSPPFILTNGYENYMGFDVNMLAYVCYYLHRNCEYKAMTFAELLPSITTKQADIAVSGIIITQQRLLMVAMSNPYLVSSSRFMTYKENKIGELTETALNNARIGIEKGTVFSQQLRNWQIPGIEIVEFDKEADEIEALAQHNVDYILMDNYTSVYWVQHSEGKFKILGKPITYGFGYGIAIDPNNQKLVSDINEALNAYIQSEQYKQNFNFYLSDI